jgi:membrane protein YdbS with pleckstrin-like domain
MEVLVTAFFRKYPLIYVILFTIIFVASGLLPLILAHNGYVALGILAILVTMVIQVEGLKYYKYKIYNYRIDEEKSPV